MGYRSGAPGRRARARRAQTARRRKCACRRALLGTRSSPDGLLGTRAHGSMRARKLTLARAHTSTHASAHRHARAHEHTRKRTQARARTRRAQASERARMRRERTKYRQRLGLLKPPRERQDRGLHSAARPCDGPNGTSFLPWRTGGPAGEPHGLLQPPLCLLRPPRPSVLRRCAALRCGALRYLVHERECANGTGRLHLRPHQREALG